MNVPFCTADFLERAVLCFPDRVAIVDEPGDCQDGGLGTITYGELGRRAKAMAAGLDALGIGVGERVAIVSQNSGRFLESLFGVTAWGRVLVPINFRLSPAEVEYIVEHSGSTTLLVDPELDEQLASVKTQRRYLLGKESDGALLRFDTEPVAWEPDEDATATINYTSGTTARPKGVELTHRNIWVNGVTFGLHAGVSERETYLHTLPMFHCNGWGMPFLLAGMGAPQVVLRKVDGTDILTRVRDNNVTLLCAAPAVLAAVLDAAPSWQGEIPGRDKVRVVCAGAPPPTRTIQRVTDELGWELIQIYGLTETSPLLTMNRQRSENDHLSSEERAKKLSRAGQPAIGVKLKLSEEGEVLARSNVVLKSYWAQPEESAKALEGGWFHTGDGGSFDDEGYLSISDRKKDVIITGGENVSSIEVEDCLFSHASVAEVAVIGVPSEKWGETIKALVVLSPGSEATEEELIKHCKDRLAGYKAPTSVEFRPEIPRTATGKIQKFKLRAPYWEGLERQVN